MRHVVCRADEIPPGARRRVVFDGRAIAIFNVKGEYFAISDTCPHRGASLAGGILTGLVTSTAPGQYDLARDGEIIRCPWHAWEFDLRTGRSHCDPKRIRALCLPVDVVPAAALTDEPLKVDAFPLKIEGDVLVVTV
jgi:nitrite reductase/ring-hydroxylating ferredoxin subunit